MDGFTGFLFGNVDESGRLESDIFDDDEKRQLKGLRNEFLYICIKQQRVTPPNHLLSDFKNKVKIYF